jgi:hypothetical protein
MQEKCPICRGPLKRQLHTSFRSSVGTTKYTSSPSHLEDYSTFSFIKEGMPLNTFLDAEPENMASPSSINLIKNSPPSIHFIKFLKAYSFCPKNIEYALWATGPTFKADEEQFTIPNYRIIITDDEIEETVNDLVIPTHHSHVLTCTLEEIKDKINKLLLLH